MTGTFASRMAFKAIARGLRLPRGQRLEDFARNGRTLDEINRHGINVVLDVGANRGFYAKHLRMLGYSGLILSFEPDPETFDHLAAAANGDAHWLVVNKALGAEPGNMDFNVIVSDGETVLSSFHTHTGGLPTKVIKVPVDTVANVLEQANLP